MDTTPNLALPYIAAAQAQKHVTHNEAIRALDALVHLSVAARSLAQPPAASVEGARYIVAAGAGGAWLGREGQIAAWQDGAWTFYAPGIGWRAWVGDEEVLAVWTGASWQAAGGQPSVNPAPLVGVNATADLVNRLAVKADATLFSHDDVTPGTGDMRQKLNKAAAANTLSQLYQTGYSGRAETGLTGDDDFHVKVSADGSTWNEAFVIDRATGLVDFKAGAPTVNGAAIAAGGAAQPTGLAAYVRNRTGANLHFWHRALRRMMQLGERPRLNMYGDSITVGTGGLLFRYAPAQLLADELTRRGFPARANVFGTSFGTTAQYTAYEPRTTFTGTWGTWSEVQGKSSLRATSASATLTYAPGYSFDRVDIHHIQQTAGLGGGGSFVLTIDGGATQFSTPTSGGLVTSQTISVPAGGGFTVLRLDVTIAGAPAIHTITLTNGATGVFEVYGMEPWTSTAPEIRIRSAAGSGLSSASLVTTTAAQSIWRLPCDLYVLSIGRNDSNTDVAVATYGTNLDTIETNMRVNGISSILYWTPPPAATSVKTIAQQQTYVDEMITRAGTDIVLFDQFKRWLDRGGQAGLAENTGGDWYDDTLHPSQWGNRDIARALTDVLLWAD